LDIQTFTIFFFIGVSLGIIGSIFNRIIPAIIGGSFFGLMGIDLIGSGLTRQVFFYDETTGNVVTYSEKVLPDYVNIIGILLLIMAFLYFYYAYDMSRR